jgi:hypothetical protein
MLLSWAIVDALKVAKTPQPAPTLPPLPSTAPVQSSSSTSTSSAISHAEVDQLRRQLASANAVKEDMRAERDTMRTERDSFKQRLQSSNDAIARVRYHLMVHMYIGYDWYLHVIRSLLRMKAVLDEIWS